MANKLFKITIAGESSKELLAPCMVTDSTIFAEVCQKEYDRQHRIQLSDKVSKAQDALAKALEKGEVTKVKKDELKAKIESAKEAFTNFEAEVLKRVGSESGELPEGYYAPTGDRLASIYVWSMFKTGANFNITGFHSLWVNAKIYKCDYADNEETTDLQKKAFKALKESTQAVLSQVFNTVNEETNAYKNYTVGLPSAWVVNNFADSVYGKLVPSKKGISRQFLKESESTRQLVLNYLQFLGVVVDDSVKKSEPESMETRTI